MVVAYLRRVYRGVRCGRRVCETPGFFLVECLHGSSERGSDLANLASMSEVEHKESERRAAEVVVSIRLSISLKQTNTWTTKEDPSRKSNYEDLLYHDMLSD